jgi:hypothetical protein
MRTAHRISPRSVWPLRLGTLLTVMLLCGQLYGGRLPESRRDSVLGAVPSMQQLGLQGLQLDTGLRAVRAVPTLAQVDTLAAGQPAVAESQAQQTQRVMQAVQQHYHWVLWPLLGIVLLAAGLAGRRHVQALEAQVHAPRSGHERRVRKPWRTWSTPDWLRFVLGLLALLGCAAVGVLLGNLLLASLGGSALLVTLALLVPIVLLVGIGWLLAKTILASEGLKARDGRLKGHGMKGCGRWLAFWFLMIFIILPAILAIGAVLMFLSFVIFLGATLAVQLALFAFLMMAGFAIVGALLLILIRD